MPIPSGLVLQKIVNLHIFSKSYLWIVFFRSYVYNINNKVTAMHSILLWKWSLYWKNFIVGYII